MGKTVAYPNMMTRFAGDIPPARSCQWPIGELRTPGFHFCGADVRPGKPYCQEHCARAYAAKPLLNRKDPTDD